MEDATTLMLPVTDLKTTAMNTIGKPSLQTIPGEIRNEIWRMLLTTSYAFKEPTSEGDGDAHYELHLAILRVNRQIYNETRGILVEGNMWIFLCVAMPKYPTCFVDETARLPVVSRSVRREGLHEIRNDYPSMNSHALKLSLFPNYTFRDGDCDCHTMIMGPESLPYFLQLLFAMVYIYCSFYAPPVAVMEMHVGRPACFTRSRLQKEILEPFSAVRWCNSVFIKGNVDEEFACSLMVKMRSPWESKTELLEFSDAYLKKGDAAAAAGLTKAASFLYEQGSQFTFFAGQLYIDEFHPQANHVYVPLDIASMLNAFDVRLAKMLLKLRCYADVQRLTATVLARRDQSRATSTEKVQLTLSCALVSLALGETARFSQIMRGLFRGFCALGVFSTESGWTKVVRSDEVFPEKLSMVENKDATIKEFDDLVAYCKEGEVDGLRRMGTGGGLPDREEIELPAAQHWSAIAAKYEDRRKTWARNKSVTIDT